MMNIKIIIFPLAISIASCAGSSGVIPIGPDTYMLSEQGWISTQSIGELKAKAFKKAGKYCTKNKLNLMPVKTNAIPGAIGRSYPEFEFMCLPEKDIELGRPKSKSAPNIRIEDAR